MKKICLRDSRERICSRQYPQTIRISSPLHFDTIQFKFNSVPPDTTQHNTTQHNTAQYTIAQHDITFGRVCRDHRIMKDYSINQ
ncbi:hypothetical protein EYC84_006915 [Monilinia fructicola]|uniref:Uncharacterized protein n=1 Tax=Monilinia fructicola TaxID=38448 RepID=A0A5M9K8X8_MONFR|nr:hypothetical protein EYC84_006915 [Monilinia fructicola]